MAKGPTSVPAAKKFPFVRGTWPPQPPPMYAQQADIKPAAPAKRDYGKNPPLAGNTGQSGLT